MSEPILETVREHLDGLRGVGLRFESAWPVALVATVSTYTTDPDWIGALADTRPAWAAAYARDAPTPADLAIGLVADGGDREPYVDEPASCAREGCKEPMPPGAALNRRYCSKSCRAKAYEARRKLTV